MYLLEDIISLQACVTNASFMAQKDRAHIFALIISLVVHDCLAKYLIIL